MTKYSRVKHKEKIYSIPPNLTTNHHAQHISAMSVSLLNLHPTTKFPPVGKEYMCFQKDVKTSQAAKCIKYRIMTNFIDYIFLIDTFEEQCVVCVRVCVIGHRPTWSIRLLGVGVPTSDSDLYGNLGPSLMLNTNYNSNRPTRLNCFWIFSFPTSSLPPPPISSYL